MFQRRVTETSQIYVIYLDVCLHSRSLFYYFVNLRREPEPICGEPH